MKKRLFMLACVLGWFPTIAQGSGCSHATPELDNTIVKAEVQGYTCRTENLKEFDDANIDPPELTENAWHRFTKLWAFLINGRKNNNSAHIAPSVEFFFYRGGPINGLEIKDTPYIKKIDFTYTEVTHCHKLEKADDTRIGQRLLKRSISAQIRMRGFVGLTGVCRRLVEDTIKTTDYRETK